MKTEHPYYITTPIYYVNGKPHIGSALTTICCDVLARYQRARGRKTHFLTGTDEQATKVAEAAQTAGMDPQTFVDGLAAEFRATWLALHVEFDDFIRTTEPRHVTAVQEFFRRLQASGDIYLDNYEGWYCVSDETFFRDTDVGADKMCPNPECGKPLKRVQEESYFFKLSAYTDRLLQHYKDHPEFLQPSFRRNEVVSFAQQGLRDMSITRANSGWGIPVPGDPGKVIYVWFDALINYLAAAGWPDKPVDAASLWPAALHMVGKEIFVRFHATLWPAMLMAAGLPLPKQICAHGWWVDSAGRKEGKRTGGLPHPVVYATELARLSGATPELAVDALRYLLLREMAFPGDSEYSHAAFVSRYNSDLANDLGNLCNRTITMAHRYFGGITPAPSSDASDQVSIAALAVAEYEAAMAEFQFDAALTAAWKVVARLNRYIEETAPWKLAKAQDTPALSTAVYNCLEGIRLIGALIAPFMPAAALALWKQLGIDESPAPQDWSTAAKWGALKPGTIVRAAVPLYPRIVPTKEEILPAMTNSEPPTEPLQAAQSAQPEQPAYITIDDFMKVELRVADIVTAQRLPNSDKLLQLSLRLGDSERTILAGIAEMYEPDELVGRQIVIVANLQPRKMRGVESQGMMLAADVNGQAIILQPETPVPSGARVR